MVKRVFVALSIIGVGAALVSRVDTRVHGQPGMVVQCLHDSDGTAPNRARREAARTLARAINSAQGRTAEATRRYVPLAQLPGLPPTPDGFILRLYTDGDGYVFSVKDDRDPCGFGIFSDQKAFLYEGAPSRALVAS